LLFTTTPPERQGDVILLFFRPEDATRGERIYEVSVHYDGLLHRLTAIGNLYRDIDPGWTTPATYHGGGYITARGPIPMSLFVAWSGEELRRA